MKTPLRFIRAAALIAMLVVPIMTISLAGQEQKGSQGPAAAPGKTVVKHLDADGAAKLLKDNPKVVVLDVRRPEEFSAGHIRGATNVNFQAADFDSRVDALDKSRPYLVHCAAGGRSTKALETLKKAGVGTVYHLDGGLQAWEKAGKPVEK